MSISGHLGRMLMEIPPRSSFRRLRQFLFSGAMGGAALAALLLAGCGGRPEPYLAYQGGGVTGQEDLYEWKGDDLSGPVKIVINLTTQRADVYVGGQYAGWTSVATGKAGFDTPAGDYKIVEKVADKTSGLYGKIVDAGGNTVTHDADIRRDKVPPGGQFVHAPMSYWMRLTWTGIGMHAGPIPQPGTPASHGCIRLPDAMAEKLFSLVKIGTPVEVVR
jgi:hypothetical protein